MKKILGSILGIALSGGLGMGVYYFTGDRQAAMDAASEVYEKVADNGNESRKAPEEKVNAGKIRRLEMPAALKGTPERIIEHTGFTLSFNREQNNPNWVAWELTADETEGNEVRSDEFLPDPMVPEPHRVTTYDYRGSGYDRGHMCPAADMKWSAEAMHDCFYMSNICPQTHSLNGGGWQVLEKACRRWARQEGGVYIICGPVYGRVGGAANVRGLAKRGGAQPERKGKEVKIGSEHQVTVPDGFFKCVLSVKPGEEKAIAFYYANNGSSQTMQDAAVSVDDLEALTGMNFFINLDRRTEARVEAEYDLKAWR